MSSRRPDYYPKRRRPQYPTELISKRETDRQTPPLIEPDKKVENSQCYIMSCAWGFGGIVVGFLISFAIGAWVMDIRCKELNKAASILQRLDDKLSSEKWPINCASPEDVKNVPHDIAKSEWAGFHRHYMNIATKIDNLGNTEMKNLNSKIGTLENTVTEMRKTIPNYNNVMLNNLDTKIGKLKPALMENFHNEIGKVESTSIKNLNNKIGNLENTLKEMKKAMSNDSNVMLNEIRKLEESGKLEDILEITLQLIQTMATVLDNYTGNFEDQTKAIRSIKNRTEDMTTHIEDIKTAVSLNQMSVTEAGIEEDEDSCSEIDLPLSGVLWLIGIGIGLYIMNKLLLSLYINYYPGNANTEDDHYYYLINFLCFLWLIWAMMGQNV